MILVRMVFQAKWGKAGEVAKQFEQSAELMQKVLGKDVRMRILTDLSGSFDTVVQEFEVESLAEWERRRAKMFSSPEFEQARESMAETPFVSGRAEFYTIEATI
jgi:hypothetical protein